MHIQKMGLSDVLWPVSTNEFVERFWDNRPLLVKRSEPSYFGGLASLQDFERAIGVVAADGKEVQIGKIFEDGHRIQRYLDNGEAVWPTVVAAFNSGYTLALYSVEKKLTQLLPLVQNLEKELSSTISGILFVSPKSGSQGFLTHYDEDDNYLLQLHGRKRWLVWKPELDWTPGSKQFDNNEIEKLGEPVIDAILETGDSLYVPRGWIHCVLGVGETSMHLSLIPDATTWLDLVQEGMHALFESLAKDSRFNKSLPLGLMRIDEAVLQPQFEILVKLLPENVDFSATLNNIKVKIRRTMLARTDSHFLRSTEQINSITLVRVRPGLRNELQIFSSRNAVGLKFVGNELELPAEAAPAIEFMIDRDSFQAKDIPLNVEVETKIQLIQDLIRGTFLEVVH